MAKYCPECGTPTVQMEFDGRVRNACPSGHFIEFANTPMSSAALVFRDEHVLLVRRQAPPHYWALPGGYLEQDESILESVQREVLEETGVAVRVHGLIAFREIVKLHRNEFYLIFLADAKDDTVPVGPDDAEISTARYVPLVELPDLLVTDFTRRIIAGYQAQHPTAMTPFEIDGYMPHAIMFGQL